mmetsp:Transcript_33282/g.53651  ORF Transcript_33282/g.53651 Transcript_33282/m.53651 type:complete len:156 (-) Transcript_33282:834-1301(-)
MDGERLKCNQRRISFAFIPFGPALYSVPHADNSTHASTTLTIPCAQCNQRIPCYARTINGANKRNTKQNASAMSLIAYSQGRFPSAVRLQRNLNNEPSFKGWSNHKCCPHDTVRDSSQTRRARTGIHDAACSVSLGTACVLIFKPARRNTTQQVE